MIHRRPGLMATLLAVVIAACSSSTPTPSAGATRSIPPSATRTANGGGGTQGGPGTAAPGDTSNPGGGPTAPGDTPAASSDGGSTATPAPTPQPVATPIAGLDQLLGTDGRFTMLVLGSDARKGLGGERTDTIMVVTVNPQNGKVAMVSLPRDTARVPIAPGRAFGPKINGLFQAFQDGELARHSRKQAYQDVVDALQYTFGIEIDRYALAHFPSVVKVIDAMGGIDVKLSAPFNDPTSHVLTNGHRGLFLKAGKNHLNGNRTLGFARSRHTSSDYDRARRQQLIITIALNKVLHMGVAALPALEQLGFAQVETNLKAGDLPALLALAQQARLTSYKSLVLGPRKFETEAPGFINYLKLDVVRQAFSNIFSN
jgi:polyisoprenyl-teichoic acid--peptidoglycan teichoic acid transferase